MALEYVGGNSVNGSYGDYSISLTALTGGLSASASAGDIVIVAWSNCAGANVSGTMSINTSGYTALGHIFANDTRDTNTKVSYKVLSGTPDTTISVRDDDGGNAGVCSVHVWRGIDTTTPMDVTFVSSGGGNTGIPDPGSITPITVGAYVIAIGTGTSNTTRTPTAPTGYSNLIFKSNITGGISQTCAICSKAWTSGAEDPGVFGGMDSNGQNTCSMFTIALRTAPEAVKPNFFQFF